jgi:predicted HicB family RNase H-like nuclease
VPNKPKTPKRGVRVDDELWEAAQREAADRGESLSEALRRFLERYVKRID